MPRFPDTPRKSISAMKADCGRFNTANPIGATIHVWTGPVEGAPSPRQIREPGAIVLGGHSAVVYVTGGGGCIILDHVSEWRQATGQPIPKTPPHGLAPHDKPAPAYDPAADHLVAGAPFEAMTVPRIVGAAANATNASTLLLRLADAHVVPQNELEDIATHLAIALMRSLRWMPGMRESDNQLLGALTRWLP